MQETKLPSSCHGYNIVRCDRQHRGGGSLAFIIRDDVVYRPVQPPPAPTPDQHLECMSIALKIDDAELRITNVYIPPVNSIGANYRPSIAHLLNGYNHIVLGDFNAHHPSWYSALPSDTPGNSFADEIEASDYVTINEDQQEQNNFIDAEKRTYVNFNKANWEGFADYIEAKLSQHPIPSNSRREDPEKDHYGRN